MTRVLIAVLLLAVTTACAGGDTTRGEDGQRNDAEAFKQEMDAFTRDTLPLLEDALGGEWAGFVASFVEKGGNTGQWEYAAEGTVSAPRGTAEQVLDRVATVLREQGMEVTRDHLVADVAATRDNISVQVTRALDSDVESVSALRISFSSFDRLASSDDYAEDTRPTDLLGDRRHSAAAVARH
jgi:hypothetical protein